MATTPAIGSREWLLQRNPNIFDASKSKDQRGAPVSFGTAQYPQLPSSGNSYSEGLRYSSTAPNATSVAQQAPSGQYWWNDTAAAKPQPQPQPLPPYNPSGGGGGGGGGSTTPPIDTASILALLGRKPQAQTWQSLDFQDYVPTQFRDFNSAQYDTLRAGLKDAIGADRTAGMNAYGDLRTEMGNWQNSFNAPTTVANPTQSAAMQRMLQANGTPTNINQADTNRGIQADAAFGNVLALLGGVNDQAQQSRLRAVGGDERRLNETLDAEQRGGDLMVNMSEAQARDLYEKEKWEFGEEIAQMNYQARTANQQYNNTGVNTTNAANTQSANSWNADTVKTLIQLIAEGAPIDPAMLQGV